MTPGKHTLKFVNDHEAKCSEGDWYYCNLRRSYVKESRKEEVEKNFKLHLKSVGGIK